MYHNFSGKGIVASCELFNLGGGSKSPEFYSGDRACSRDVRSAPRLDELSDEFVSDNQILAEVVAAKFRIGEIPCPTRYEADTSSIGFRTSMHYGLGVLGTGVRYRQHLLGWRDCPYLIPLGPIPAADSEREGVRESDGSGA